MSLHISVLKREEDFVLILSLKGTLDTETFDQFKQKAIKCLISPTKAMVLDLQYLEYISSMGISAIVEIRKMIEDQGGSFMIVNVPKQIEAIFNIIKALPNLQLFKDMEEADAYFLEIQKRIKEDKPK